MNRPETPLARALLILGMHRSGTSAAARVVNLLGAELGNDCVPPGPDNPEGFWEHAEAVRIDDDLLHGLGRTWYDMRDMSDGWIDSAHAKSAAQRIGRLIERDFAASSLCVVKDPRMCLTAPLWIDAFETRGFEVDCLFIVRDPREVVESLHRRNDWPCAPLYLMWVQYLMEATAASERQRRAIITYDQLLSDWRGSMTRVADELHLRWPVAPADAVATVVDAFLDRSHRHHREPPRETGCEDAALPSLASTLYQACLGIASGESKWTAISDLHDSFNENARLYAAHVDHLLTERWSAEARAQTAEARLLDQASVTAVIRDSARELQEKLDARLEALERSQKMAAQHARTIQASAAAQLAEQASATSAVHGSVQQLQNEMSAWSGETAARFERQRERTMAVEARIQRQHSLLNTISLQLEQAANDRAAARPGANGALLPVEVQQLRSALASSNATIAALIASTSWKLTVPLRWLSVHLLRRPPAAAEPITLERAEQWMSPAQQPPDPPSVRHQSGGVAAVSETGVAAATESQDHRDRHSGPAALHWKSETLRTPIGDGQVSSS